MDAPSIKCEPLATTSTEEEGDEPYKEVNISYQDIKTECLVDSSVMSHFAGNLNFIRHSQQRRAE